MDREYVPKVDKGFHWLDFVVFVAFILVSLGFGVYYVIIDKIRGQSAKGFLGGKRDMSVLPVTLAILSSLLSAIIITGTPAEIYTQGTIFFVMTIGMILGCLITSRFFVPLFYPLALTSTHQYLELRFNSKWPKLLATIMLIIALVLNMGIAAYAPATSLESVVGFPTWATILIGGFVAMIYTALGGLKASVWASAFQTVIMIAGVLAVIIKGSIDVGGLGEVWRRNSDGGRIEFFVWDPNPLLRHSTWNLVLGGMVTWTFQYGCNQASVQRYCTMPTIFGAKLAVWLNIPGIIIFMVLTCFSGMVIYAYYSMVGCDPLTAGYIDNPNQLISYFVMDRVGYPGIPGLFMAALFSGSLSTVSATQSALAALTYQDLMKPFLPKLSDRASTFVIQGLVVFYGLLAVGTAFLASTLGGTVLEASLSFVGATGGPIAGLFFLGAFFPCTHWIGAIVGGIVSLGITLWISLGSYTLNLSGTMLETTTEMCMNATVLPINATSEGLSPDDLSGIDLVYLLSYVWYPTVGVLGVLLIGLITSCAVGLTPPKDTHANYMIPVFDKLCCYLPNKTLRILRCNLDLPAEDREVEDDDSCGKEDKTDDTKEIPPPYDSFGKRPMDNGYTNDASILTNANELQEILSQNDTKDPILNDSNFRQSLTKL